MQPQESQTRKSFEVIGDELQFQHRRNSEFDDNSEQKSLDNCRLGKLRRNFAGKLKWRGIEEERERVGEWKG